jgi:hypothetical protein
MGIVRALVQHQLGGRLQVHKSVKGFHISLEAAC